MFVMILKRENWGFFGVEANAVNRPFFFFFFFPIYRQARPALG